MPAALLSKEEVLDRLMNTFRQSGYDGASLAELSLVTGLGKSSLYHHFPGGKAQMAAEVLRHLDALLTRTLYAPLRDNRSPRHKLDGMLEAISIFYEGGKKACLLERLCASTDRAQFRKPLMGSFQAWIASLDELAQSTGVPPSVARERAEDAIARIEGALVLSAGTGSTGAFTRAIEELRTSLLRPAKDAKARA